MAAQAAKIKNTVTTVELSEVLDVIEQGRGLAYDIAAAAAEVDAALAGMQAPLIERIERNRRRSARNRAKTPTIPINGNGNGHAHDVRLVITQHGLMRECRKCGRAVA